MTRGISPFLRHKAEAEEQAKKEKMTEKEAKQEGKSTFAKRAPTASSWDKWHVIRDSYNSFVRDKVDHHTYVEDW